MTDEKTHADKDAQFLSLLMSHQKRIFGYIQMLVPISSDADDIMQETVTYMWRNFDKFEPGTNFAAWGTQIARFRVLKYRQQKHNGHVIFDDELFQEILNHHEASLERIDDRLDAIEECLKKLNDRDLELVRLRYGQDITTKELAQRIGRPVQGLYKTLSRIHCALSNCVLRVLASRGAT